ncbi:MAG: DUF1549 and DUF1553 domain-containing protein [Akkermansiaceae bacterium]
MKPLTTILLPFLIQSSALLAQKADSKYWAYQPVQKVSVPAVTDPFVRNPIDAFILAALQENGIKPNERADEFQLRRRLSYDLTGLPPEKNAMNWSELVDHYLDSPRFGEKFATHWLDLVRYAETNGFERDSAKPEIWRYRDYVIKSFNENKGYDRFILEQLAGDQLPDKTLDSCIATGFMTLMQRDDEPADRPQAHADRIGDIVDVSSEAFMGTTMGCAKCHDHKVDPISQADYFSMMSFFDGIRQDLFKSGNQTWIDPEVARKREEEKQANRGQIEELWKQADRKLLDPYLKRSKNPRNVGTNWVFIPREPKNPGWSLPSFDANGAGFKKLDKLPRNKLVTSRSEFGLQEIPKQFLIYLKGELQHLQIFINGAPVHEGVIEKVHGEIFVPLPVEELTTGKNVIGLITKFNRNRPEIRITREPVHDLNADQFSSIHSGMISGIFGDDFGGRMKSLQQRRRDLERPVQGVRYHGVHEEGEVAAPRIHTRGSVHAQGDEVPVAFPVVLDSARLEPQRNRLELAEWIVSPEHPTTARVWVNRLWQYCFGAGLVESSNEFGKLGTGVSDQKLLDYLAGELVKSGWDTKHILRLMLNSSTYQLSSKGMSDKDPGNRLHWRYSSRRLSAEEIWDSYLVLTKQMKFEVGGPPVRPKMPDAVLRTSSRPGNVWPPSPGDSANRRAVYIHVKRSIKLPLLANFDSPERDFSCPSRFATTVPTQALTMLNSERINEFSSKFAARLNGSLEEQIREAFRLATSREITDGEFHELTGLAKDLKEKHGVSDERLMSRICLLILNLNETLYLD